MASPGLTTLKILRYLESNPDAMDSEKGISSWWVQDRPKNIHSALKKLVSKDVLKIKEINGEVYYSLSASFRNGSVIRELILSDSRKNLKGLKKPNNPKLAR